MHGRALALGIGMAGIAPLGVVACSSDDGGGAGTEEGDDGGSSATGATEGDDGATLGADDTTGPLPPDMGLQPPSACESACATRAGCGASEVACLNQCDADYGTYMETSSACVADFEALLSCLTGSTCDELDTYDAPPAGEAYPCQAEDDAFTTSCLLGGEPPPATCEAYCAVISECAGLSPNECDAVCSMQLLFAEGLGETCVEATTMQLDCVGTLDCPGYEAFDLQEGDFPCMAETTAVDEACGM
jgi:hypothetical protein